MGNQTLRVGQVVKIADGVTVRVLEIGSNRVRLGIIAPDNIPIYRFEVWDRLQKEKPGGK